MRCTICNEEYFRQTEIDPEEPCWCTLEISEERISDFRFVDRIKLSYIKLICRTIDMLGKFSSKLNDHMIKRVSAF